MFKLEKRRYSIVTFMLNVYGNDIKNWRVAHCALQCFKEHHHKKEDSLNATVRDLMKVYILDSLT